MNSDIYRSMILDWNSKLLLSY